MMKILKNYFLLEYKKSVKVLSKTFVSTLLTLLFAIAGIWLISYIAFQSQIFEKVKVAVFVPESEKQVKVILRLASSMESVDSVCEFEYLEEDEAMLRLRQGKVAAAILLPEDFYEDIDTGYNTPLTVYVSKDAPLNQRVFQELLTDGVSLLRTSEAGVYAMLHTAKIYSAQMTTAELGDYIAAVYLNEAFNRDDVFEESIYSSMGEVDVRQYYIASAFNLILLMLGLNFGFLYRERTKALEEQLKAVGIGAGKNMAVKITVMTVWLWCIGLIGYAAGLVLSAGLKWNILYWDGRAVWKLLLLSFSVAVYLHLLYALTGGSGRGTFLMFAITLGMILCSGGIVPAAYLPHTAALIGKALPLCIWNQFTLEIFFLSAPDATVCGLLAVTVIMTGIGVAVSWKNT